MSLIVGAYPAQPSIPADIHDYARSLTAQHHRVEAIELHSAPRGHGSAEAHRLSKSCPGIGTVPESPSNTAIPQLPAGSPRKGFLPIETEIDVLTELCAAGYETGLVVNWGRSVIESHDPHTAAIHIETARRAGVLSGVMFSGCSPQETEFEFAWIDAHLPPQEVQDAPKSSLLNMHQIQQCLAAAGSPDMVGFKIGVPAAATSHQRARLLRHMCTLMAT